MPSKALQIASSCCGDLWRAGMPQQAPAFSLAAINPATARLALLFTFALALLLVVVPAYSTVVSEVVSEPLQRPSLQARHPQKSALMAITRAGTRLVAVGERGIVLLSDDDGIQWRQAPTPVSITLTAVHFATPQNGWAVGHYGVVLHSNDGGQSWMRQMDGKTAAALTLKAAQRLAPDTPNNRAILADAERMVAQGPDKPFLDLYFVNDKKGFVVGAYNLFLGTEDGGATWFSLAGRLDNPKGNHLYSIRGNGKTLYIAGEQGVLFRSDDAGQSFKRLNSPYEGSFFTLALLPTGEVIVAGLRGNAFRSDDQGITWTKINGLPPISVMTTELSEDQNLWLGNQAGQLFVSTDRGRSLSMLPRPPIPQLTNVLPLGGKEIFITTLYGVLRLPLPPGK